MATIARLMVQLGGDNAQLQRVFTESATQAQQFTSKMQSLVNNTKFVMPPITMDTGHLDELREELKGAQEDLATFKKVFAGTWLDTTTGRTVGANAVTPYRDEIAQLEQLIEMEQAEIAEYRKDANERVNLAKTTAEANAKVLGENAVQAATDYVTSLKATLDSQIGTIQEKAARGFYTGDEAKAQGMVAITAYNQAILDGLDGMAGAGLGEETFTKITGILQGALNKAGIEGGREAVMGIVKGMEDNTPLIRQAAQQAVRPILEANQSVDRSLTQAGGGFTTFGRRFGQMTIGLGFGLETFVNGTETGMRRALRSVESFALMFGPEGLLISGIITAGLALFDFFHKAQKEAEDTVKKISSAISSAVNSGDQQALLRTYRELLQGTPTTVDDKGKLVIHQRSTLAANAFEGGAADYQARINQLNDQIATATQQGNVALVGKLSTQLKDLQAEAQPIIDQTLQVYHLLMNPIEQDRMPGPLAPVKITAKGPHAQAIQDLKDQAAEITALVSRMDYAKAHGLGFSDVLERLSDILSDLGNVNVRRAGESWEQYSQRVGEAERITKAFADLAPTVNVPKIDTDKLLPDFLGNAVKGLSAHNEGITSTFDDLVARYNTFKQQVELTNQIAKQTNPNAKPLDGEQVLGPLRNAIAAEAARVKAELASALNDPKLAPEARKILQSIVDGMNDVTKGANAAGTAMDKWAGYLQKAASAAQGVSKLSSVLDPNGHSGIGKLASDASSTFSDASAAIASGGTDIGADLSTLADVISVGNDLQGQANAIRKENNAVLNRNTQHMEVLAERMAGFAVNANTSGDLKKALDAFFANAGAVSKLASGATHSGGLFGMGEKGDLQTQIDALTPTLQQFGLTFNELKEIAQQYGIEIFDKNGRIITSALQQFATDLTQATKATFTFANTLADQKTLSDLNFKLSGVADTPQNELKNTLALFNQMAPQLLPGSSGLNLDSADGQEQLRRMLQGLVAGLANGTIDPSKFGNFQNLGDVTNVVDSLVGSLVTLRDTTDGLNEALQNSVQGWKIRLATFDATDAITASQRIPPDPTPLVTPTGGGTTVVLQVGENGISINGNRAGKDMAQDFLDGLGQLAADRLGNRTRWTQLTPRMNGAS